MFGVLKDERYDSGAKRARLPQARCVGLGELCISAVGGRGVGVVRVV